MLPGLKYGSVGEGDWRAGTREQAVVHLMFRHILASPQECAPGHEIYYHLSSMIVVLERCYRDRNMEV
jgi:hypothetical protein